MSENNSRKVNEEKIVLEKRCYYMNKEQYTKCKRLGFNVSERKSRAFL